MQGSKPKLTFSKLSINAKIPTLNRQKINWLVLTPFWTDNSFVRVTQDTLLLYYSINNFTLINRNIFFNPTIPQNRLSIPAHKDIKGTFQHPTLQTQYIVFFLGCDILPTEVWLTFVIRWLFNKISKLICVSACSYVYSPIDPLSAYNMWISYTMSY